MRNTLLTESLARRVDEGELRVFLVTTAALLVVWGPKLVPNFYSFDDYALVFTQRTAESVQMMLVDGRFVEAGLWKALVVLGIDPPRSVTLLNALAIVLLGLSAVVVTRIWRPRGSIGLIVGPVAMLHPNFAELWTFRVGPFFFAVALLPALIAVALPLTDRRRVLGASLLLLVSFSIYQTTLNTLLVVLAFWFLLAALRGPSSMTLKEAWREPLRALLVVLGSTVAYLVIFRGTLRLTGLVARRGGLVYPSEMLERAHSLALLVPRYLYDTALSSTALAVVELTFLFVLVGVLIDAGRRRGNWPRVALVLALLVFSLAAVVGVHSVLRDWWPAPRALISLGLWFAGCLTLLRQTLPERWGGIATLAGTALAILFAGIDARVNAEQLVLNARDQAVVASVLNRFRVLPEASRARRLVFINAPLSWPDIPATFDLNISALHVPWSIAGLVRATSELRLENPGGTDFEIGARRCAGAPRWPDAGSVVVDRELALVCF